MLSCRSVPLLLSAGLLFLPRPSHAQVTVYTSRSAFSAAAGAVTTFSFDGYTSSGSATEYPTGLIADGVLFAPDPFSAGSVFVDDPADGNGDPFGGSQYLDTDNQAVLNITLPAGTKAFGADFSNYGFTTGDRLTASFNDGQAVTFDIPDSSQSIFEGFVSTSPLVNLSFTGGGFGPALDNVTLSGAAPVPESSSWISFCLLLALGAGMISFRKDRSRKDWSRKFCFPDRSRSLVLAAALLACISIPVPAYASDIVVDLSHRSGALKKAGLGSLFGVSAIGSGTPVELTSGSLVNVISSESHPGTGASNPFSTEAVAPLIRGTGTRLMCRFNDLLNGFSPYTWPGYNQWISAVTASTHNIQSYKDVVYGIEVFNEPDNEFNSSAFMNDPLVLGNTYDAKVNYLWVKTVQAIRAIDKTTPIMGPNYEYYRPSQTSRYGQLVNDQARMTAFLQNAIATGTVPSIIGWHSLSEGPGDYSSPYPGDVPASLAVYRALEAQLNLPGRPLPVSIDEYGPNTGDFEGVPGSMVKYWAEFERSKIDFGGMGIYNSGGTLGNTLRYDWDTSPQPNGGWYMMNWYRQMQGQYVPVSRWNTRYYQAFDGVASWDPAAKVATVILGGSQDDATVHINGIRGLGLGISVRVQLDTTVWDVDPNQNDQTVEHGGDPKTGTYSVYDKVFPLDSSGNITVPVCGMNLYNGYRLLISAVAGPSTSPGKYEAENALVTDAVLHNGSDGGVASGSAYIGGIDNADSAVQFSAVTVPARGIYLMTVRYANNTGSLSTQAVTVNGVSQGQVLYTPTPGWGNVTMRTTTKRVALNQGINTIKLTKGTGYAELDYINVRPDTHRYDAEFATVSDAALEHFSEEYFVESDFVGSINNADSFVEFAIDAPVAGTYTLTVGYANGTGGNSALALSVGGAGQGSVNFPPTGGWLSAPDPRTTERTVSVPVTLAGGVNTVRLQKANGYVELDYAKLGY